MKNSILITFFGVTVGLSSAFYFGQSERPFPVVSVKFCPQTANGNKPNYTSPEEAQSELDKLYCQYEQKLLKQVWDREQFKASKPIGDKTVTVRDIPASINPVWLLIAPGGMWSAYAAWAKKTEIDSETYSQELERFKTKISTAGIASRQERNFKSQVIANNWDTQRVKSGLISVDAMQDQLRRQTEVQDALHASAVKSFVVDGSVMDKAIAENLRDAAKADKERAKLLDTNKNDTHTPDSSNQELVNNLVEALKNHENGWLWKIVDNQTPLWLIGRQGCGKTWKAATFAMVRKYCLNMPVRHLIDEHATGDNTKIWKYLEPQQISESLDEIVETFESICESWKLRIKGQNEQEQPATITPEQIVIDEYTELKSEVGEPAEKFYKRHLKDTRKAKSYVIGVTHNDTNSSYPDGTQSQRESGTILIQAFSANGRSPLPRVKVVRGLLDQAGNEQLDFEGTIPDWFLPETIHKHFHGSPIEFQ